MTIKEYITKRKEEIKLVVGEMKKVPSLTIVQINEDSGSNAYVKGKIKDAKELGIKANLIKLPLETTQEELMTLINSLNNDCSIDGFIVQMPLPKHINEEDVKLAINPKKDVDGFHPLSPVFPCTPKGIINYLKNENITLCGKNALVIGRSNIVGKPMAKLLLNENANVTIIHSKTPIIEQKMFISHADLIVIAIGKMGYLNSDFIYKKDAVIVDVGISRSEDGLHGDAVSGLPVRLQTPVPGGVGLLTRLALFENLLELTKDIK